MDATTYPHEEPLNDEQIALLNRLYYDEKNFFGYRKLAQIVQRVQRDDPDAGRIKHIYWAQVKRWLDDQEVSQRFRQAGKRKDSRQVHTSKTGLVQVDTLHMEPWNGYTYILNVIDVYSRKAWSFPMKNLTAATTKDTLTRLFHEIGASTWSSDNGTQFAFEIDGIEHIRGRPHVPQNQGKIERFNGSLRLWLGKAMYASATRDWVSLLPKIIENYNRTPHEGLGNLTPEHVHGNQDADLDELRKQVDRDRDAPLEVGQRVRIRNDPKTHNDKSKTTFSAEVYTVSRFIAGSAYARNRYQLKAPSGTILRTWYNSTELLAIDKVSEPPTPIVAPQSASFRRVSADDVQELPAQRAPSTRQRKVPAHLNIYRLE